MQSFFGFEVSKNNKRVAQYAVLIKTDPKSSLENKAFEAWFVDLPHPPSTKMYAVTRTSNIFELSNQKSAKEKYLSNITYGVTEVYSRYFEYECSCSKNTLLCVPTTLTSTKGEALYVTMIYRNMDSMFMVVCTKLMTLYRMGHAVVQLVDALCYEPEGPGFNSRWCHWNFSLT